MKTITMVALRKWREQLSVDTPVITREAVKGIVINIDGYKCRIMFGKCHEANVKLDDLFPIAWEELINSWRNKKAFRDTDIPIDNPKKKKKK